MLRLCVIGKRLCLDRLGEGIAVRQKLHQIFIGVPHPFQDGFSFSIGDETALQLGQKPAGQATESFEILAGDISAIPFRKRIVFPQPPQEAAFIFAVGTAGDDFFHLGLSKPFAFQQITEDVISA